MNGWSLDRWIDRFRVEVIDFHVQRGGMAIQEACSGKGKGDPCSPHVRSEGLDTPFEQKSMEVPLLIKAEPPFQLCASRLKHDLAELVGKESAKRLMGEGGVDHSESPIRNSVQDEWRFRF